jgi:hypothetical protein
MGLSLLGEIKAYLAEKLSLHLTFNNKSQKTVIKNTVKGKNNTQNNLTLNLGKLSSKEKKELIGLLQSSFDEGGVIYVDDDSKRLVDSVKAAEGDSDNGDIVAYFKDKLNTQDWQLLRSGLYISYLVKQGMPTQNIRKSVIDTYGERGKNLLNLASSGHFSTHIKPLYEELSKAPNFSQSMFYDELERILKEMPFAFFVNSRANPQGLCDVVNDKIEQAKLYAVKEKKIYLHGWGPNVKTIEDCLDMLDDSLRIVINKRKEVVEIIDVTIEF